MLFRFGVSDGRTYDELLKQHVDPLHNTNDRRWIPVTIDLSAYAGQQVDIIFNTNSSLPGRGNDTCVRLRRLGPARNLRAAVTS